MSEPTRLHTEGSATEQPARVGLVATVETALAKAGRDDTPDGAIALRLAETLADGGHTASGIAALAKELRATVESALKGAETAADGVDELKQRRERRRGA